MIHLFVSDWSRCYIWNRTIFPVNIYIYRGPCDISDLSLMTSASTSVTVNLTKEVTQ